MQTSEIDYELCSVMGAGLLDEMECVSQLIEKNTTPSVNRDVEIYTSSAATFQHSTCYRLI